MYCFTQAIGGIGHLKRTAVFDSCSCCGDRQSLISCYNHRLSALFVKSTCTKFNGIVVAIVDCEKCIESDVIKSRSLALLVVLYWTLTMNDDGEQKKKKNRIKYEYKSNRL